MKHIRKGSAIGHDPAGLRGQGPVDYAIGINNAREIHLREYFNNSGSANAGNTCLVYGCCESRLIGPRVRTDHLKPRFKGRRIDPHTFDCAGGCALSTAYLGSFEGRPGWTAGREESMAVAQNNFRIGSHIDQQRDFLS